MIPAKVGKRGSLVDLILRFLSSQHIASARNAPPGPPASLFPLKRKAKEAPNSRFGKRRSPAATVTQATQVEDVRVMLVEDLPRSVVQPPVVEDQPPPPWSLSGTG